MNYGVAGNLTVAVVGLYYCSEHDCRFWTILVVDVFKEAAVPSFIIIMRSSGEMVECIIFHGFYVHRDWMCRRPPLRLLW